MKAAKPGAAKKSDKREVACVAAQPSQPSIRGIAKKVAKMSLQARLQLLVKARVISEKKSQAIYAKSLKSSSKNTKKLTN
jgi:hypothetical protein